MIKKTLKPDSVLKDYWRNNERFADLFNQALFGGSQQILPEKLSDKDTEESAVIMEKDKTITSISRSRDIMKQYADGVDFVLIGIENQMHVHYGMPVRSMTYEALDYTKQCKELAHKHRTEKELTGSDEFLSGLTKDDKLKPIYTLVVYYGEKSWNGPVKLSDMMNIPVSFLPYFNDYNINLLSVHSSNNYHFRNQDNYDFFTLLNEFYSNKGKFDIDLFNKNHPNLHIYWETLAAIGAAAGSMELVEYAFIHEGGNIPMCLALENLKKEGIREGIREGIQEGSILGMIAAYRDMGCPEEIMISKLKEKLNLSNEEIQLYLNKQDS